MGSKSQIDVKAGYFKRSPFVKVNNGHLDGSGSFPLGIVIVIIDGLIFHLWRDLMLMRLFFVAFLALMLAQPAIAERGDPEEGRILALTCFGCHAIPYQNNVYPTYSVPLIAGQSYGYVVAALKAYRTGERRHPTMEAQANTLSDQDIYDIAAFVSQTENNE